MDQFWLDGKTGKMKTLYLAFFLVLALPVCGQFDSAPSVANEKDADATTYTGILTGTYANGVPKFRKEVINGKADGLWLEWLPDGTLRFRSWWKDGFGHGKWEYFHPNGQLRSVGFYEKDLPAGLHQEFHPNGQMASETPFVSGKREGIVYSWDKAGIPTGWQRYASGKKVLDQPVLFQPGQVATKTNNEWGLTFTPDGDTLYFTRRDTETGIKGIYVTIRTKGTWTKPEPAPFSRPGEDGPFISSDGKRFYTEMTESVAGNNTTENNLWYRTRQGTGWSTPQLLGANINGVTQPGDRWPANYESGPAGNLFYWTKSKNSDAARIYSARLQPDGNFSDPVELPSPFPKSGSGWEFNPVISPDGNYLFFVVEGGNNGYGGTDIYYTQRTASGGWATPKNLGPEVNSFSSYSFPRFSPDGKYFYFSSDRAGDLDAEGNRIYSIYHLETKFLQVKE